MSADPLRDDLGVELERLMAIEPAPDLAARVRARVADERVWTWWPLGWQLAGVAALVTVLAAMLVMPRGEGETGPLPVSPPSNAPSISIPVLPLDVALRLDPRPRDAQPTTHSTRPAQRAVHRVVAHHYPVLVMPPLEPVAEISIEPVAIEPLSAIAPLSGERQ